MTLTIVPKHQFTKIAEDVIAKYTDLDAIDDHEAYQHAMRDLELEIEGAVDDRVAEWLETRRIGAIRS